ncbi:MAG: hypothetical protein JWN78_1825 [Bacteroidota bacterium]|nr:hypothetical protein [Bacteroidota bacterium]
MKFGKLESVEGIDLSLPKDHAENALFLKGKRKRDAEVYIGFPIWSHPKWVGTIYPPKAKAKDFLSYYSQQYNAIELNATHYNTPKVSQVEAWKSVVPGTFKFCPKVPQFISHAKDIATMKEAFEGFINAVLYFDQNLGCVFFLLSPHFKPDKLNSLIKLLDTLPQNFEMAIELRHEDWFTVPAVLDELCKYLVSKKIILIITDVSGRRDILHQRLTTKTAFVRFTGNDLHPSDFTRLDEWVKRCTSWLEHGLEKLYFFVHTPEKHLCPELSYYFIKQLNKNAGTKIPLPKPLIDKSEPGLFD